MDFVARGPWAHTCKRPRTPEDLYLNSFTNVCFNEVLLKPQYTVQL